MRFQGNSGQEINHGGAESSVHHLVNIAVLHFGLELGHQATFLQFRNLDLEYKRLELKKIIFCGANGNHISKTLIEISFDYGIDQRFKLVLPHVQNAFGIVEHKQRKVKSLLWH